MTAGLHPPAQLRTTASARCAGLQLASLFPRLSGVTNEEKFSLLDKHSGSYPTVLTILTLKK